MMFDDDIIVPDHNRVSSEWEKNEVIRKAYDRARALVLPRLIDLLEQHVGESVWVASTDLFHTQSLSELWSQPAYLAVHGATKDLHSGNHNHNTSIQGTTTQLFFEKQDQRGIIDSCKNNSATANPKTRKGLPDKCLLKHEFSPGCHWFMVCKLRRRHQKEIAKHPFNWSSSSESKPPWSSSTVLDGLVRSAVLKHCKNTIVSPSKNNPRGSFGGAQNSAKGNQTDSATNDETIEKQTTSDKDDATIGEAIIANGVAAEVVIDDNNDGGLPIHQPPLAKSQESMLQEEANTIVTDALSIVRAAKNLEIGVVPKRTVVRWKAQEEFEIRYFK